MFCYERERAFGDFRGVKVMTIRISQNKATVNNIKIVNVFQSAENPLDLASKLNINDVVADRIADVFKKRTNFSLSAPGFLVLAEISPKPEIAGGVEGEREGVVLCRCNPNK